MNTIKDGGPAFPCEWDYINSNRAMANGMTLRDYFAAKAMEARLAAGWTNPGPTNQAFKEWRKALPPEADDGYGDYIAGAAYDMADAMLKARESA